jgi:selenocysteine lyase/cysteine desulfurase
MQTTSPVTYLNTAACGLIDESVKRSADDFYTRLAISGSTASEAWRAETEPKVRHSIAALIGAETENIALIPNFSWGLNGLVQSLRRAERVMLYEGDYPSLTLPFRNNRFIIQSIAAPDHFTLPLDEIRQRIRNKEVDIVALSHVQYNSGYRLPLAEIGALCREHGVYFIVDATQSLGAIPVNVMSDKIDVLISSNYKWMNAGFGSVSCT